MADAHNAILRLWLTPKPIETSEIADALRKAIARIERPECWEKRNSASRRDGSPTHSIDSDAVAWHATAAIWLGCHGQRRLEDAVFLEMTKDTPGWSRIGFPSEEDHSTIIESMRTTLARLESQAW